jgi:hypothetical protein
VQLERNTHVPKETEVYLRLITFATEEMGEIPRPACFVSAIPNPIKSKDITKSPYRLTVSICKNCPSFYLFYHKPFLRRMQCRFGLMLCKFQLYMQSP